MAEKVVSVRLQAKVDGFTAGMRKAKSSLDDLTKADVPKKAQAFGDLADKAALAGLGIAAGLGVAVKRFADFDKAMSAVQANSGETGATLDALRETAIKLGADSQFSATEAAEGINEMSKAGVQAKDILGGGLKGALDLAAAGQVDVAFAAESAATAMVQFNLDGSKVPHIADLMTNAANKAQGGVGDLAMALKQGGLVASSMGLSIEETTAGLAAFASAGLIGSDAGTSLKTMLQRLANPSKEAAQQMADLGISAYDSAGNFVGLEGVAGQLKTTMTNLTPAQRDAAMATIFGSDAVRAANVLYQEGSEGIAKWTKEVSEQGAAARQAATLTDNLAGDVERLGGALDSAFIQTGSGANDGLRSLTQGLTGLVDIVAGVPGPVLLAGGALTSLALLAPKGILMWRNYNAQLDSLGLSMDKVSKKAPRLAGGLRIMQGAMAGFAVAATVGTITNVFTSLSELDIDTAKLTAGGDALEVINERLAATADLGAPVADTLSNLDDVLQATFSPGKGQQIDNFFAGINSAFGVENVSDITVATERLRELDTLLAGMAAGGNTDGAKAAFDAIAVAAAAQGVSVDELKAKFPQYREALNAAGLQAVTTATQTGALTTQTSALDKAAEDAEQALSDLQEIILGLGSPVASQRQATRDYEAAIDAATASVKENGKALNVHTEKGRANQQALDSLHGAILEKVRADYVATEATKGTDAATRKATASMKAGREAFIRAATAAGMTKSEAKKLADQLGLIPDNVKIAVKQTGAQAAEAAIDRAARNRTTTITVQTKQGGYRYTTGTAPAYGGGFQERAGGGPIWGAGTKTSDSIPIWASTGEFMQKAAAVDKYGLAFMHAVNSLQFPEHLAKGMGFAEGGPMPRYAPAAPNVIYVPAPAASRGGDTYNLTAIGSDAEQATRRALREFERRTVSRL